MTWRIPGTGVHAISAVRLPLYGVTETPAGTAIAVFCVGW